MFGFIKKCFFSAMMVFGCNILSVNPRKYVSMNYQECKVRPEIISINSNEPLFYLQIVKTIKCSGSCNNNNVNQLSIPDVVKNINVKEFNLMSRINETRHIKRHGTCKCKCRLDASVCKL